jgi:hypothetical protein
MQLPRQEIDLKPLFLSRPMANCSTGCMSCRHSRHLVGCSVRARRKLQWGVDLAIRAAPRACIPRVTLSSSRSAAACIGFVASTARKSSSAPPKSQRLQRRRPLHRAGQRATTLCSQGVTTLCRLGATTLCRLGATTLYRPGATTLCRKRRAHCVDKG